MMQLYSYYRSSSSYRVRIALNSKGLAYKHHSVHLLQDGGQQHAPEYKALNPQELVPTFIDGAFTLTQSMAIMEYLEEKYPQPALLPKDIEARAYVRQLAMINVADIHPINNLKILQHITDEFKVTPAQKREWYHKWIAQGFNAIEKLLARSPHRTGAFCCGDQATLADICLVPQVYNARRYELSMKTWPLISAIERHCLTLKPFIDASPGHQPDTPADYVSPA